MDAEAQPRPRPGKPTPPWVRTMVVWMDEAIPVPGTQIRLGIDPILGLLAPGVGDGISAATHLVLLGSAFRARVPRATLVRMAINVAIDAAVGAIPLAGDLFDIGFKANRRNLALLERMEQRGKGTPTLGDYVFLGAVIAVLLLVLLLPILVAGALLALVVAAFS